MTRPFQQSAAPGDRLADERSARDALKSRSEPIMTKHTDEEHPSEERLREIDEAISTDTLSFFAPAELIGFVIDLATALEAAEARARTAEEALRVEKCEHAETQAFHDEQRRQLTICQAERDLLQEILDSRPAINAGLPDSYIRWSRAVMSGDAVRAGLNAKKGSDQ